ncbi:hypothetical protein [Alkaliphilus serpentinus]|uniref:MOSC domain-containing protein n=1 Tax=Alkaliphilus serpentinus TaxID=1482731 RepID=A0A833HRQ0_9FIRM|nr:hypothetical protein [Alkaliphilus serpentinus]KAB3533521.1 hypothetical protein F8153_00260 [Alkaliphilus serpentinus]
MGRITYIFIKDTDKKFIPLNEIHVNPRTFDDSKPRQVSFISVRGYNTIENSTERGFCHNKFVGNFVLDVDFPGNIKKNVQIHVGDAVFLVEESGKDCHRDCPLLKKGDPCSLRDEIAFGRILHEGSVCVGDEGIIRSRS